MAKTELQDRIHAFPTLLIPGTDDTFHSAHSYETLQALVDHSLKMSSVDKEYALLGNGDKMFRGKSSSDLAQAFQAYAAKHVGGTLSHNFTTFLSATQPDDDHAILLSADTSSFQSLQETSGVAFVRSDQYSWAALLCSVQWVKIVCAIIWMASGILLLFFGLPSFHWLTSWRMQRHLTVDHTALVTAVPVLNQGRSRRKQFSQKQRTPLIAGGVGGLLVGFLGFSYVVALIHNSLCAERGRHPLPAVAFFAVWFASGLAGACLCGHFGFLSRTVTALLSSASFVIVLTAVFGIRLLLVRIILVALFGVFLMVPLIQSRAKHLQMLLLNACTSFIGMVTFLNGVALVLPSSDQSWIDLWTLLFLGNGSFGRSPLPSSWQSSIFKGFTAASVIGAAVGFAFEWLLHRDCGLDPDADWNQYLGNYTQQFEATVSHSEKAYDDPVFKSDTGGSSRAGMFEPAPSAWQKMKEFFESDLSRPAHYGNLSGDDSHSLPTSQSKSTSPLSDKIRKKLSDRSSRRLQEQPARFSALKRIDHDDDFDDASSDESGNDEKLE